LIYNKKSLVAQFSLLLNRKSLNALGKHYGYFFETLGHY
jgi:hypothetical protein